MDLPIYNLWFRQFFSNEKLPNLIFHIKLELIDNCTLFNGSRKSAPGKIAPEKLPPRKFCPGKLPQNNTPRTTAPGQSLYEIPPRTISHPQTSPPENYP